MNRLLSIASFFVGVVFAAFALSAEMNRFEKAVPLLFAIFFCVIIPAALSSRR